VNGEDSSIVTGVLIGSTTAVSNSPAGLYPIMVSGQSAANYTIQYANGTLSVLATPLLVAANNANRAYGQTNPVLSVNYIGFVNGETNNVLGGTLLVTTPADTNSAVGTYPIIPSGLSATNYAISYTNGTLTVSPYALSVTASNASRVYGAANPVLTGSLVGLHDGDNISASYTTVAGTNSAVGSYAIVATLNDPDHKLGNYAVTTNNGTLTVTAASLMVTANNASRSYGVTNPVCSGHLSGVRNGDNITATYATTATPASPIGAYNIVPSLTDPNGKLANYSVSSTNGILMVTSAALSVTANNASRPYGVANPVFTGVISGIQNSDAISATYSSAATPTSPVGTYSIVPTLMDPGHKLSNYTAATTNGTLTITVSTNLMILSIKALDTNDIVITWTSISNQSYQVQYKSSIGSTNWTSLSPIITATNNTTSFTDHPGAANERYYRIALVQNVTPVVPAPVIQSIIGAGTPNVVITWSALSNHIYRVQYETTLGGSNWTSFSPDVIATGSTASFTDLPGGSSPRFYRIVLLPTTPAPGTPVVQSVFGSGTTNVVITWSAISNDTYQVQYKTSPTATNWLTLSPTILATGGTASFTDNPPAGTYRYYQIVIVTNVAPVIQSIVGAGTSNVVITWISTSNSVYRVQYKTSLSSTNWVNLPPDVTATGSTTSYTDDPGGATQRFYRVVLLVNATPQIALPVIQSLTGAGTTNVVVTWSSISNRSYMLQYKADLSGTNWLTLASNILAASTTASVTDHPALGTSRFYRVGLQP
jgi:hypothetical protein